MGLGQHRRGCLETAFVGDANRVNAENAPRAAGAMPGPESRNPRSAARSGVPECATRAPMRSRPQREGGTHAAAQLRPRPDRRCARAERHRCGERQPISSGAVRSCPVQRRACARQRHESHGDRHRSRREPRPVPRGAGRSRRKLRLAPRDADFSRRERQRTPRREHAPQRERRFARGKKHRARCERHFCRCERPCIRHRLCTRKA